MARIVGWQDECGGGRLLKKCIPFSTDEGEKRVGGRNKKELFVLCIWIKRCIFASHFGNRPLALGFSPLLCPIDQPGLERCSSGWRGTPGKRVNVKSVSGVRIPLSPREVLWNLIQRKSKKNVSIVTSMSYDTFLLYIIVLPEYPNTPKRLSCGYNLATLFSAK